MLIKSSLLFTLDLRILGISRIEEIVENFSSKRRERGKKIRSARISISSIRFNPPLKLFQTRHRGCSSRSSRLLVVSRLSFRLALPLREIHDRSISFEWTENENAWSGRGKMKSYAVLSTLIGGKGLVRETYLSRRRGEREKRKKERKNDRSSGSRYKCTKNRLRSRLEHSRCRGVRTLERSKGGAGGFLLPL